VSGGVYFSLWNESGGTWDHTLSTGKVSWASDVWWHVGCTFEGTNKIIYVEGVEDTRSTFVGTIGDHTDADLIVGMYSGGLQHFDGQISEVRIASRPQGAATLSSYYNATTNLYK
jgi:hypothetical protein